MAPCIRRLRSPGWLRAGDIILALFIFFPAQVLFWRGAWDLLDLYLLPGDMCTGSWISLAIGLTLRLFYSAIQVPLNNLFNPEKKATARKIFIIIHNLIFSLVVINHWRGLWTLLDCYTGFGGLSNGVCLGVSLLLMWLLRCSNMALSAPFYVVLDSREDLFESLPRFRTPPSSVVMHAMDQLFSLLFCYGSAIAFWRALWNLQDVYLLPDRYIASNSISVGIGYVLFAILLIVEMPAVNLAAKWDKKFWPKIILEDTMILVGSIAIISAWRGFWNIAIAYVMPEQPLGGAMSVVIGGVPLWLAGCSSSLYDFTMCLDGGYTDGEGCTWDIFYLQDLFGKKEEESEAKDAEEAHALKERSKPDENPPCSPNNGWATPYDPSDLNEQQNKFTFQDTGDFTADLASTTSKRDRLFTNESTV